MLTTKMLFHYLQRHLNARCKVLMTVDGPNANVLKIKPPMVFDELDAGRMLAVLKQVISLPLQRKFLDMDLTACLPSYKASLLSTSPCQCLLLLR